MLRGGGVIGRRIKRGGNWKGLMTRCYSASQASGDTQGYNPIPTNRTADPAIHSSEPQMEVEKGSDPHKTILTEPEPEPFTPPNPPTASSQKLSHTEVGLPSKPNSHQRRQSSAQPTRPNLPVPEIACSEPVLDPWPDDNGEDRRAQSKAQEEDNKEYFKDHKASPLSEIEFADTRKPITQATDSDTTSGGGVIVFKEEQRDSAEEALMRAAEIWNWNKMRGDPDSPHGRVLRQLRGESW